MDEFATMPSIEPGEYEHYKGNRYEVLGIGAHTETLEYFVVYKALYARENGPEVWLRPYELFVSEVEVDGQMVPRFKKVEG